MKIEKYLSSCLLFSVLLSPPLLAENKTKENPESTKKKISKAIEKFDDDVKQGVKNVKQELKKIDKKLSE